MRIICNFGYTRTSEAGPDLFDGVKNVMCPYSISHHWTMYQDVHESMILQIILIVTLS